MRGRWGGRLCVNQSRLGDIGSGLQIALGFMSTGCFYVLLTRQHIASLFLPILSSLASHCHHLFLPFICVEIYPFSDSHSESFSQLFNAFISVFCQLRIISITFSPIFTESMSIDSIVYCILCAVHLLLPLCPAATSLLAPGLWGGHWTLALCRAARCPHVVY